MSSLDLDSEFMDRFEDFLDREGIQQVDPKYETFARLPKNICLIQEKGLIQMDEGDISSSFDDDYCQSALFKKPKKTLSQGKVNYKKNHNNYFSKTPNSLPQLKL